MRPRVKARKPPDGDAKHRHGDDERRLDVVRHDDEDVELDRLQGDHERRGEEHEDEEDHRRRGREEPGREEPIYLPRPLRRELPRRADREEQLSDLSADDVQRGDVSLSSDCVSFFTGWLFVFARFPGMATPRRSFFDSNSESGNLVESPCLSQASIDTGGANTHYAAGEADGRAKTPVQRHHHGAGDRGAAAGPRADHQGVRRRGGSPGTGDSQPRTSATS